MYFIRKDNRDSTADDSVAMHITERPNYPNEPCLIQVTIPSDRSFGKPSEEAHMIEPNYIPVSDQPLLDYVPERQIQVLGETIGFAPERKESIGIISTTLYRFEGEMKDTQRHGFGVQLWTEVKSLYIGQFVSDKLSGGGILTHSNGDKYEGQWKDNQADGHGKYTCADGSEYDGDWKADKKHGYGTQKWADGQIYKGNYKNGMKEGLGTIIFPNGEKYDGDFHADQIEGRGKYTWPDGRSYEGFWKEGKMHGEGLYIWYDETGAVSRSYKGTYVDGKKHGKGLFTWPNGSTYYGNWANGKQQGEGVFTNSTSVQHKGIWDNGTLVRFVTNHSSD